MNEERESRVPADDPLLRSLSAAVHELVAKTKGPVSRLSVQAGDYRVEIEWDQSVAGAGAVAAAPMTAPAEDVTVPERRQAITAPLVGAFYRRPEPGAEPFVEEGDVVEAGQTVAIIEAMKIMNPIEADRPGRIAKILVGDGEVVEFGQELMLLESLDADTDG